MKIIEEQRNHHENNHLQRTTHNNNTLANIPYDTRQSSNRTIPNIPNTNDATIINRYDDIRTASNSTDKRPQTKREQKMMKEIKCCTCKKGTGIKRQEKHYLHEILICKECVKKQQEEEP